MGIQTAGVLYPINSTTLYSGAGKDIRLLSDGAPAVFFTQIITATHTQDNNQKNFRPDVTNSASVAHTTFQGYAWGLRLTEDMTPADDVNCNAVLTNGALTINISGSVNQSGGTYAGGNYGPTWVCHLWEYDPDTHTAILIASNGSASVTWDYTPVTGDLGTFKPITFNISIPSTYEFTEGRILIATYGITTGTIPNPTLGTATWEYILRAANGEPTNITFAAGQGIRQLCRFALDATTVATSEMDPLAVGIPLDAITVATPDLTKTTAALVTLDAETVAVPAVESLAIELPELEATTVTVPEGRLQLDFEDVPTGGGGGTTVHPVFGHFE